ncbi:MAG: helix-turn-helix transcriptional regulator [Clostridia bacterium]|nr:helix-turn-helix transcriptional regulator [Clostridia bacterium]MBQ9749043.1 helix-turn-helix transcriptional regulator [Clostridia bacterium]
MLIKYDDLPSIDFTFENVNVSTLDPQFEDLYDCQEHGRVKHLIFYQLGGKRRYFCGARHICTLEQGDILFIPHGTKYRSFSEDPLKLAQGMGLSFDLRSESGEVILFSEEPKVFHDDHGESCYRHLKNILYAIMHPHGNRLLFKSEIYSLLERLFDDPGKAELTDKRFRDIKAAIEIIERSPEKNLSVKELSELCLMSESTFARRFKQYSGGSSPIKYRNKLRIMLATELAKSSLTTFEIATSLGFYDSAHLCKMYRQETGKTLKNKI